MEGGNPKQNGRADERIGSLLKLSALSVSERIESRSSRIRFGKNGRE